MRQLRDVAVTVLTLAVLGVLAGLIWSLVAPRAPYVSTPEGAQLADPSTQALIAADGWFAVITGVAGLVCGVLAYVLGRQRLLILLGLTGGSILAAWLARWTGGAVSFGTAAVSASGATAAVVPGALRLTATGVVTTWPLLAVAAFGVLMGVNVYRDPPRRAETPADPED
ncbi:hypothetical protein Misp01_73310 [Microtetraspora sp. NBRC 13810]|uniref:hypothetical protein n=1 Tax=Microtetraspora sp. NBRC 13810 TaxID=3030990 RepID=UPI0024A502EE|nr:hypothetical protein [Microtetraspora sp. NBRC 13810]GLW12203.1 hypothetical protein Misp01_73310 [Microtetraspora sp. NBRC 13810]